MSTTAAKKKKNNASALSTTGKSAIFSISLGFVFLTLGLSLVLSLFAPGNAVILADLHKLANGLAGVLSPALPFLFCWLGLKFIVCSRHKVSVRDILLVLSIYLLLLASFTLLASVGTASYLEYISQQAFQSQGVNQDSFESFLFQSYKDAQRTSGSGGMLGMLLAYPLWKLLTRIGGFLLVLLLLLLFFSLLLRFKPSLLFVKATDAQERWQSKHDEKKRQKERDEEMQSAPLAQSQASVPMEGIHPGQAIHQDTAPYTPPQHYQPAPIYQTVPVAGRSVDGFYPVQPTLYDERYPLHQSQSDGAVSPAWEPIPDDEPTPPHDPEPFQEVDHQAPLSDAVKTDKPLYPSPRPDVSSFDEEELPWDPLPPEVENPPLPAKECRSRRSERIEISPSSAISDYPAHTTTAGEPQPVYTDPVMPITGERIPIRSRKEKPEDDNSRIDGTAIVKTHQTSMNLTVKYEAPPISLLSLPKPLPLADTEREDVIRAQTIEQVAADFQIGCSVREITHGPAITRFAIQLAPGIRVNKLLGISRNLALELKTQQVRISPIPRTNYIGLEAANSQISTVHIREVLDSPEMRACESPLTVALGKDIAGTPILCDLSKMPHLLIAGATGSGKSVCINSIICSLIYRASPDQVRLILVDPKQVELSCYNGIPHLLLPVICDPRKAAGALSWTVVEMKERYAKFSAANVRSITAYNKVNQGTDKVLPNIVVIIDEMADLMMTSKHEVEDNINSLAALARAAGIYLVVATQRPSVNVITGVIKSNIPSRIAFAVSSGVDSRTILDTIGAESLVGKGDMLYKPTGSESTRVQGCFVTDDEIAATVQYVTNRYEANYDPNIQEHLEAQERSREADEEGFDEDAEPGGENNNFDDLLAQAILWAFNEGQTSISMLQRRLRVGYARAGRLIDDMESRGIIGPSEGSKPRKVIMSREEYFS